jgi:hypothetical protein
MANLILNLAGSIITFAPSGGTVAITLTSLGNGAGRVSAQWDRGAGAQPGLYIAQMETKAAAALAVGAQLFVYLLQSSNSADVPGNLGTADAAVASSDKQRNLGAPIITINADSTSNGEIQISNSNIIEVYGRYVSLFAWNALGQALTGTGGDHYITLTPVPAEVQ